MPDKYKWFFTHNVSIDSANNIYVIHEGDPSQKDHPTIFVFDDKGNFLRAFGSQFQGGGHGIDVRKEGNEEFIYVAAYQQVKSFAKLTLTGEIVWYKRVPIESGVYNKGMALSTKKNGGRKTFLPTNFAFLDGGGFLVADGYGSYYVHEFDKDANWLRCFGGPGEGKGKFDVAHGLWGDDRPGRDRDTLLVTDRSHNSIQRLTMSGEHIETIEGFDKPCTIDTWNNEIVVPEYGAMVSILDEHNQLLVRFDAGARRVPKISGLRSKPERWKDG